MHRIYVCLSVLAFMVFSARAQSTFGSIVGAVQDKTGAVIPGVEVEITNLDENTTRSTQSNGDGQYSLLNLPAGRYSLMASKSGLASVQVPNIALDARQERRVDLTMDVAAVTQSIRVEAAAVNINTENGTIASTLSGQQVTDLPSNYRGSTVSPLGAIVAMPNVQQDAAGGISVAGSPGYTSRYSVDGTNNNQVLSFSGGANVNNYPSTELLAEFKVSAVGNNAEFASTGDITITTKSGTNVVHGSAFEYLQNRDLDATTYGSPTKQGKVWNTFGGSFSGPVMIPKLYDGHNKTFFFVDYEGNREPGSTLITGSLPTAAMRAGNLNGLPGGSVINPATGAPFPNNQIPASMINPVAANFLNLYYPLPNFNSGSTANDYRLQVPIPETLNGYDVKIDQNFGAKNQVYGRWDWKNVDTTLTNGLLPSEPVREADRNLTLADNYTITPSLLNEFRFGFAHVSEANANFPLIGTQVIANLGITGLDLSHIPNTPAFPEINFSAGTGFSYVVKGKEYPGQNRTIEFADNLSWIKGKHTMKFGVDIYQDKYAASNSFGTRDDTGDYNFSGAYTGNAFADFLLGVPTYNFVADGPVELEETSKRYAFYGQDEYRLSNSVTLTFGLRYSVLPKFTELNNDITAFSPTPYGTGTLILPTNYPTPSLGFLNSANICPGAAPGWNGTGVLPCTPVATPNGASAVKTDWADWAPRLGLAWRPFGNNKTVFRGSIGIFTVIPPGTLGFQYIGYIRESVLFIATISAPARHPRIHGPRPSPGAG